MNQAKRAAGKPAGILDEIAARRIAMGFHERAPVDHRLAMHRAHDFGRAERDHDAAGPDDAGAERIGEIVARADGHGNSAPAIR